MTGGRYQNGCRYQLRYLISADCKAVRGKGSEVATSDHVFLENDFFAFSAPSAVEFFGFAFWVC